MSHAPQANIEHFYFRHLHPQIKLGMASDRYAGWLGQVYSEERYRGRLKHRTKVIGEQSFTETVVPVESVAEYFEHFPVLEIDFTFYRPSETFAPVCFDRISQGLFSAFHRPSACTSR